MTFAHPSTTWPIGSVACPPRVSPVSGDEEYLRLASVDNFRDVAGPGYATSDGGRVRTGVFYRSNDLRLTEDDHGLLSGLGLTAVIDLRSVVERSLHPDPEIPGAEALHFDASGVPMERLSDLRTREEAVTLMDDVYRTFVTEPYSREAFGGVLRQLSTGGPQLFHCTAGKDRTGWVAALLLDLAGVDDATIEADYLQTNVTTAASRARTEAEIAHHLGADRVPVYEPTLVVRAEYLTTAWDAVDREYGDRASYLRDGLGLDDTVLTRLRELLRAG